MKIKIDTSLGFIEIALDEEKAPISCKNFLVYVEENFYDKTIFHRVIDGFMIQGGGFDESFKEKNTFKPISNEADNGLKNKAFTIAMARTNDPHSATAQFFINLVDNAFLDHTSKTSDGWGYAVFGSVEKGKSVVTKIGQVATGSRGFFQDVPNSPVVIKSITKL